MRDSCVFYRSFLVSIRLLPKKYQLAFYDALFNYAFDGIEPENLYGGAAALFNALKPQIDANNRKFENGKKGGRPKQNQTETKAKPNNNQDITKPKPNEDVNANANEEVDGFGSQANANESASAPLSPDDVMFFKEFVQ